MQKVQPARADLWNHAVRDERATIPSPSRSVSLSSTLSLLGRQPPLKISSHRAPCRTVLNFAALTTAGRGRGTNFGDPCHGAHLTALAPCGPRYRPSPSASATPSPRDTYYSLMSILVSRAHGPVARDQQTRRHRRRRDGAAEATDDTAPSPRPTI